MPRWQRLPHYARAFDTVEINATFYNLPEPSTFTRWAKTAREARGDGGAGFRFVLKGSRYITHQKKLCEPRREPLARLFAGADRLGDLCAGFLWQFPGSWKANPERLRDFTDDLRLLTGRRRWWHAFEFRHGSWLHEPVFSILRDAGMALVLTDMPFQVIVPGQTVARDIPRPVVTAPLTANDLVYVRKHGPLGHFGGSYPPEMTHADAEDAQRWLAEGKEVYVYFNNDVGAMAILDAEELGDQMERLTGARVLAA